METNFLETAEKQFRYYKMLGEKAFGQVPDQLLFWQSNPDSNSIAVIVQHLSGNMLSRWTDFLESDGEKDWRNRDAEFENRLTTREEVIDCWESGWNCLFAALAALTTADLNREIYIRNMGHSVMDAISRQLAHYPYHVGQIVYIAKMKATAEWQSLSIPKGQSATFNDLSFSKPKHTEHFTDSVLSPRG